MNPIKKMKAKNITNATRAPDSSPLFSDQVEEPLGELPK
jgi:hypothetical protein